MAPPPGSHWRQHRRLLAKSMPRSGGMEPLPFREDRAFVSRVGGRGLPV